MNRILFLCYAIIATLTFTHCQAVHFAEEPLLLPETTGGTEVGNPPGVHEDNPLVPRSNDTHLCPEDSEPEADEDCVRLDQNIPFDHGQGHLLMDQQKFPVNQSAPARRKILKDWDKQHLDIIKENEADDSICEVCPIEAWELDPDTLEMEVVPEEEENMDFDVAEDEETLDPQDHFILEAQDEPSRIQIRCCSETDD